jgi:hypothetical protein
MVGNAARRIAVFALLMFWMPIRADQPDATKPVDPKKLNDTVKEIAGTAEFLRSVPKHFATLKAVNAARFEVTLLIEGEVLAKVWRLVPDAEVKIFGWWGRLGDLAIGDRVWVWFKTDRKKQPVAISMIADETSEQDIHGSGLTVESTTPLTLKPVKGPSRTFQDATALNAGTKSVYLQTAGEKLRLLLDKKAFEDRRAAQKTKLRQRWIEEGLPGTVSFVHVFSGEMDLMLDHETMRWARSLTVGDKVTLKADPPIKALVKQVQPWRERTQVRLVVHSFDLADLSAGQRLHLVRTPPPTDEDTSASLPPDVDRPRSRQERVEWFLANIYCTCRVMGDRCTGHFYTLASCNPNACGMPNHMRKTIAGKIDQGLSDRQIFEQLLKEQGPELLRPHLLP